MRKLRKVMALLLTLAMVMGMSLTTFAAGSTKITVNGLDKDATIKYLQVVEPDTSSTLGWKFCNSSIADAFKTEFGETTDEAALQALIDWAKAGGEEEDPNKYAEAGDLNTSSELADALKTLKDSATTDPNVDDTTDTITVSKAGLYLIVAETTGAYSYVPMLAYVKDSGSGNLQATTVTAKGSDNAIEKQLDDPDDSSVTEGDEVGYTATVEYPFYSGSEAPKSFTVTDTVTGGTYVAGSLKIYKGTVDEQNLLEETKDYVVGNYGDKTSFTITFNYNSSYAGEEIIIKYTVRVDDTAQKLNNNIETNWGTNDETESDKVSVEVTKVEENTSNPLKGAEFVIYEAADDDSDPAYKPYENVSVVEGDVAVDIPILYLKEVDRATTGENGKITFDGLDAQEIYYIKEVTAPEGYSLNPNYYLLSGAEEIIGTDDDKFDFDNFDPITVTDDNLAALPSTGGIGTTIFTIGGCVIMIAAAGLYFASRRKHGEN